MKITILGSGGILGIPVWSCNCKVCKKSRTHKKNFRTRPSILIESEDKTILVDMGQDFRSQMLKHNIKKIDYVLLTHTHTDHAASLSELRAGGKVVLEASKFALDKLEKTQNLVAYLKSRNPGIKIREFKPHKIGNIFVDSIKVEHEKDYAKEQEPCFGYVFEEKGFRFAYIPDFIEILEPEKVKRLDLFICDGATDKPKVGHIGIQGGIELYKKIKPKKMIFTHIVHSRPPHDELEKFVKKHGNIRIAYDGMVIKG